MINQTNDAFQKWHKEATELLDLLESLPGRCRALGSPPSSSDAAGRIDALATLWLRCQFLPLGANASPPWDSRASVLSYALARAPEEFLRTIYSYAGEAIALALKDQGTDSQHRLISTQNLPYFVFDIPGTVEKPDRSTAFREESGRTITVREDRLWGAVQLYRLADEHPLRQRITDGWKGGELELPSAVIGPCYGGKATAGWWRARSPGSVRPGASRSVTRGCRGCTELSITFAWPKSAARSSRGIFEIVP
jgi:hypothetical protein